MKIRFDVVTLSNISMMCMAIASNVAAIYLTTFSFVFGGPAGLTGEQLGRIGAAAFAGYCIGLIIASPLADRLPTKSFLVGGNAIIAASLIIIAVATSYSVLLFGVLAIGIGAGVIELITSPLISMLVPDRRTSALNKLHAFYSVGAVVTILLCSCLIYLKANWRIVCLIISILPVFTAIALKLADVPSLAKSVNKTPLKRLMASPSFLLSLAAIMLCGAVELGMVQWLSAYAQQALKFSAFIGGLSLVGFYVGASIGRFGVSYYSRYVGPLFVLASFASTCVVFALLAAFLSSNTAALVFSILMGLAVSCLWPTMLGLVADANPAGGVTMYGTLSIIGNFGGVVMPWVIGFASDKSNLHIGIATEAVPALLLIIVVFLLWQQKNKARALLTV